MEITINLGYRPCLIDGEKKALFHWWENIADVCGQSPMVGGHAAGQLSYYLALVEYEDGSMHEVEPKRIRFVDNLIREYSFPVQGEEGM